LSKGALPQDRPPPTAPVSGVRVHAPGTRRGVRGVQGEGGSDEGQGGRAAWVGRTWGGEGVTRSGGPTRASPARQTLHCPHRGERLLHAPRSCCLPLRLGLWRQELVPFLPERTPVLGHLGRLRQLRRGEHTVERLCQCDVRLQEVCLE